MVGRGPSRAEGDHGLIGDDDGRWGWERGRGLGAFLVEVVLSRRLFSVNGRKSLTPLRSALVTKEPRLRQNYSYSGEDERAVAT